MSFQGLTRRAGAVQTLLLLVSLLGAGCGGGSSSPLPPAVMAELERVFGAPVIEAAGKSAVRMSAMPARVVARTVEVICQTVG